MKYLSDQLLDDLHAQTESAISKAISSWQQISNIRLITNPGPGQWSAAQCMEHLNSYGRYYLPAIEKALIKAASTKFNPYFKSSWLGNYFYKLMLPETNGKPKKKMKSPKDHQPGIQLDATLVLNEFITQLEKIGQLLTMAKRIDLNKTRVPISIAPFIKLKAGDVFLFVIAHIQRHMLQAERALAVATSLELNPKQLQEN